MTFEYYNHQKIYILIQFNLCLRPSPFFFFVYRRMRFLILGRSVGLKKKKNTKKITRSLGKSRPWYPRTTLKVNIHIFGLTKCTIYCEKCSRICSCFLYAVTMLIFQIKRIVSSEKWCDYVVTFFFLKVPKFGWVGRW